MSTSQRFIATQKVSLAGYQRLRDTLLQQEHLFESVETAAQLRAEKSSEHTGEHVGEHTGAGDLVLMRSPKLTVLLIARPLLTNSPGNQAANHQATNHQPTHSRKPHSRTEPRNSRANNQTIAQSEGIAGSRQAATSLQEPELLQDVFGCIYCGGAA